MKRLDQLTFTRFLILITVLFYHGGGGVYYSFVNFYPLSVLLKAAPTGVGYLFVLSGFVMSLVYYRPKEKFNIPGYWSIRFIRFYPLYIISFLLMCYYYIDFVGLVKPQKTLANIFILQAWIPSYAQSFNYASWSMSVEIFFYAIFPFFMIWAYRQPIKKVIWFSVILWTISQLIYEVLWVCYFPEYRYFLIYFPLFHLNSFVMGVVGGIWFLGEGQTQNIKPRTNLLILAGAILFALIYVVASNTFLQLPHALQPMAGLMAPVFTLIIVTLALDKTRLSVFLNHRILVNLGETAYALYILHVPIIWIYERALENSSLSNPRLVFEYTAFPLMILMGFIFHFYIDQPIRTWLKKVLKPVSMPLLLLDLVIIALSVYISFQLRFDGRKELSAYRTTALLMFWAAFVMRTILSRAFNAFNPSILYGSLARLVRPVLISVTTGSLLIMGVVYLGYIFNWFENFPRSIFLVDWVLVLSLSLAVRFLFRYFRLYQPAPHAV